MWRSFIAPAALLLSIASDAQTGAKELQCISKAHGVVFPSPSAYEAPLETIRSRRSPVLATPFDRLFRTRIREGARSKANFAGHFVITWWGCGTGCSQFAIVDRKTGKVYDPPFANVTYHYPQTQDRPDWDCFNDLPTFSVTSLLLVVEGCLNEDGHCGRHFYVMESAGLREVQYDPDVVADGTVAP